MSLQLYFLLKNQGKILKKLPLYQNKIMKVKVSTAASKYSEPDLSPMLVPPLNLASPVCIR